MRLSRMLFGLPFACLALAAALTFFAPSASIDFGPSYANASYQVHDFTLPAFTVNSDAILAENAVVDKPADAHLASYTEANQPLASWRIAVEAFSIIDPHIRAS